MKGVFVMYKQIEQTLTSLEVAQMINKNHADLMRDIRRYTKQLAQSKIAFGDFFQESTYKDSNKQERPCYKITKKGCEFIGNKLTGIKGTKFTALYINRFHEMQDILYEHNSPHWQQTRLEAKNIRKMETAEIKELVEYAKAQGSENAEKYYMALSKLANKTVGISSKEREAATINQLNTLILVENIINHMIQEGIRQELPYKKIYQTCKQRLEQFQEITFLTSKSTKEKGGSL